MHVFQVGGQKPCIFQHGARGGPQKECFGGPPRAAHPCEDCHRLRHVDEFIRQSACSLLLARLPLEDGPEAHLSAVSPLQFTIEDLACQRPSRPTRAFSRVVCLPYSTVPEQAASSAAGLTRQVRQRVLNMLTRGGSMDLQRVATQLQLDGLQATVIHPIQSRPARVPFFSPRTNVPFMIVSSAGHHDLVVVDAALREHLAVAPATPLYKRTLAATVPELFVGTRHSLEQLVTSMASAIRLNFESQGMHVPPWRRTASLLGRWAVLAEHDQSRLLQERQEDKQQPQEGDREQRLLEGPLAQLRRAARDSGGDLHAPLTAAAERDEVAVGAAVGAGRPPTKDGKAGGVQAAVPGPLVHVESEGKVHGGSAVAPSCHPVRVVVGFNVGEGAGRRVRKDASGPWSCAKPGGLASLCRRQACSVPEFCSGESGAED